MYWPCWTIFRLDERALYMKKMTNVASENLFISSGIRTHDHIRRPERSEPILAII